MPVFRGPLFYLKGAAQGVVVVFTEILNVGICGTLPDGRSTSWVTKNPADNTASVSTGYTTSQQNSEQIQLRDSVSVGADKVQALSIVSEYNTKC